MPSANYSRRSSPFAYPKSRGTHRTPAAFMPSETRFQSLDGCQSVDAIYVLPSTLKNVRASFGTSTRADWDTKPKKSNPCAGPGSYRLPPAVGKQPDSAFRSLPTISFGTVLVHSPSTVLTPLNPQIPRSSTSCTPKGRYDAQSRSDVQRSGISRCELCL